MHRLHVLSMTTDSSGDYETYLDGATGKLWQIGFDIGTLSTPDIDVTLELTDVSATVLSVNGVSADTMYLPRHPVDTPAGASLPYLSEGSYVSAPHVCDGRRTKVVLSGAGDTKTGTLYLITVV
jgi:hypothetical protein